LITVKEEFLTDAKTLRAIKLGGHIVITMWLAMKRYCAENSSDGFVPKDVIGSLPGAPKRWQKAVQSLVDCGKINRDNSRGPGLVDEVHGGWELHDYLDHAQSRDEIELRREKSRIKKRKQREQARLELERLRGQSPAESPGDRPGDSPRDKAGDSPRGRARDLARAGDPSPAQPTQREDPPTPFPDKPVDAFTASLTGRLPHDRADVNKLHEAYKRTFELPHRTWFAGNLHEARIMAEAIDAHGLDKCLLVLAEAPNDGMVSGRDDEKKAKHESVSYIFGNSSAFDRMLRAAAKRAETTGNGKSITETMAALKDRRVS
jgi:hypothetical protein